VKKEFYYLWFTLKINPAPTVHKYVEENKKIQLWITKNRIDQFLYVGYVELLKVGGSTEQSLNTTDLLDLWNYKFYA
jgi:hypothetical protein